MRHKESGQETAAGVWSFLYFTTRWNCTDNCWPSGGGWLHMHICGIACSSSLGPTSAVGTNIGWIQARKEFKLRLVDRGCWIPIDIFWTRAVVVFESNVKGNMQGRMFCFVAIIAKSSSAIVAWLVWPSRRVRDRCFKNLFKTIQHRASHWPLVSVKIIEFAWNDKPWKSQDLSSLSYAILKHLGDFVCWLRNRLV